MGGYGRYYEKWKWWIWLAGVSGMVYVGFRYVLPLVMPFLVALLLARMVSPVVGALKRKWKVPVKLAAPVILLLLIAGLLVLTSCFGIALFKQIKGFVRNVPIYKSKCVEYVGKLCGSCDDLFGLDDGISLGFVNDNVDHFTTMVVEKVLPTMTQKTIMAMVWAFGLVAILLVVFISALLILEDMEEWRGRFQECKAYAFLHPALSKLGSAGVAFLRAQAIIMGSVAVSCSVGLWMMGNPYFMLLGVLIAALDALPIIGSGMVLIPWAIVQLAGGNFFHASVLITLYAICLAIREVLEPRLIGNRIGIKPIFLIMASFVGIKLFGLGGVFLGPVALVVAKSILEGVST